MTDNIEKVVFDDSSYQGIDLSPSWKMNSSLSNKNSKDIGLSYVPWNRDNHLNNNNFFYLNPLYYFTNKLNLLITQINIVRMYLQFPLNNSDAEIHNDNVYNNKIDPNLGILLYYVNDSDGDTVLYESDKKTEIIRVTPKKGRCIFFSNLIPHKAGVPKKMPRVVINYNFHYYNP